MTLAHCANLLVVDLFDLVTSLVQLFCLEVFGLHSKLEVKLSACFEGFFGVVSISLDVFK